MADRKKNQFIEGVTNLILFIWITFPRIVGFCAGIAYIDSGLRNVIHREVGALWEAVQEEEAVVQNKENAARWWKSGGDSE